MSPPPLAAPDRTLVEALRRHLQRRGREVVLMETHISWVLLCGRLALKLKKPVRRPFLDFSTPALRRHFCEQELRLNRRLAPTLYRAVLAVRGTAAAPRLAGGGEAIDHVLCMRRFPAPQRIAQAVRRCPRCRPGGAGAPAARPRRAGRARAAPGHRVRHRPGAGPCRARTPLAAARRQGRA